MPTVPIPNGPSVRPDASPLDIRPPQSAFGAGAIGAGLSELGAGARDVGEVFAQHANQFQAINNKVEADKGFVRTLNEFGDLKENCKVNNQGLNASANLGKFLGDLDAKREEIAGTMASADSRLMYETNSRQALQNIHSELTNFAVSERQKEVEATYKATNNALVGAAVGGDMQNFDANMGLVMKNAGEYAASHGFSDVVAQEFGKATYTEAVGSAVEILANKGDITAAQSFLESHRDSMDAQGYAKLVTRLRPFVMANDAAVAGDLATAQALSGIGGAGGDPQSVWKRIIQQESGGRPGVLGPQTPYGRAEGMTQMLPATAKSMAAKLGLPWQPGLMRGTSPEAAAYQEKLGRAYFDEGLAKYGGDVAKAAAYYHGGPDEKLWGPKTRAYVEAVSSGASVNSVSGGPPTSDQIMARLDDAVTAAGALAEQQYPGNAAMRDSYERNATANISRQAASARANESASYQSLGRAIDSGNFTTMDQLYKAVPGAVNMYNTLPFNQQQALENALEHNLAEKHPSDPWGVATVEGARANVINDPGAFLNINPADPALGLNLKDQLKVFEQQAKIKARQAHDMGSDKLVNSAMSSRTVKDTMNAIGLVPPGGATTPDNDKKVNAFRGQLSIGIQEFAFQHDGRMPTDKEMPPIVARVAANVQKGGPVTLLGIPGQAYADIQAAMKAKGYRPTAAQIVQYYHAQGVK